MVGQRRGALRRGKSAPMGPRDGHPMDRTSYEAAAARSRDGVRAALYLPAGMPDRVDGLSVEVGLAYQPGLPGVEKLDVCADARRVAALRSLLQTRTLRRCGPRTRQRDSRAGTQGMVVG